MLYVFHVDAGQMTTYDMSLTLQNVSSLKLAIERKTKVPAHSLVLLVSGGEVLMSDHMVSSYSAGTDSNPIFMFIKPYVKESHLNQSICSDLSPIVDLSTGEFSCDTRSVFDGKSIAELKAAVEKCCAQAANVQTVKNCAALAQQFSDLALEVSKSCEQLVHEQHLQHQGWTAVVANLEDIYNEFCERSRNFKEAFRKHRLKKEEYHEKLQALTAVLESLGKIPILPALQQNAEAHRFSAFDVFEDNEFEGQTYRVEHPLDSSSEKHNQDFGVDEFKLSEEDVFEQKEAVSSKETVHSDAVQRIADSDEGVTFKTTSYDTKEDPTLLHWILAQGNKASLQDILDYCRKGLALIDEEPLKEREAELYNILEYANNHGLKQIKGIEDRLYGLDQLLNDVKKLERDQRDQAASLLQHRDRINSACDPSVLPTLVQSHWCQLQKLLKGHQSLFDIRRRIAKSKDELSHILKARLEAVLRIENSMSVQDAHAMLSFQCFSRLARYFTIVCQLHDAPRLFVRAVAEVARRRTFSTAHLGWATDLAGKLLKLHEEEMSRRQEFNSLFEGHFLKSLFPGMTEMPAAFATVAPPAVDARLPELADADVDYITTEFPDLAEEIPNYDMEATVRFFMQRINSLQHEEKDACIQVDADKESSIVTGTSEFERLSHQESQPQTVDTSMSCVPETTAVHTLTEVRNTENISAGTLNTPEMLQTPGILKTPGNIENQTIETEKLTGPIEIQGTFLTPGSTKTPVTAKINDIQVITDARGISETPMTLKAEMVTEIQGTLKTPGSNETPEISEKTFHTYSVDDGENSDLFIEESLPSSLDWGRSESQDNMDTHKISIEKLQLYILKLYEITKLSISYLLEELVTLKKQVNEQREFVNEKSLEILNEWQKSNEENAIKFREQTQRLTVDHELELSDMKAALNEKDNSIANLKSEKEIQKLEHQKEIERLEQEHQSTKELVEKLREEIISFDKKTEDADAVKQKEIKDLQDKLHMEYKAEIESLRSRFRLVAVTNMDRSPSESSLEKIERTDMIEITSHNAIVMHTKETAESDKEDAIKKAVEKCEAEWSSKLEAEVASLKAKFDAEKQVTIKDVTRRLLSEKDRQLDLLREREQALVRECGKYRDTIQQLTDPETNDDYDSLLKTQRITGMQLATLENEKALLQQQVTDLKKEMEKKSEESEKSREDDSDGRSSPARARRAHTPVGLAGGTLSLSACLPGHAVLVLWDPAHHNYTIMQEASIMYFVHSDCLPGLDLSIHVKNERERKLYAIAIVESKEYCYAKKSGNRFNMPRGSRFYRVRVKPARPLHPPCCETKHKQDIFKGAVLPLLGDRPLKKWLTYMHAPDMQKSIDTSQSTSSATDEANRVGEVATAALINLESPVSTEVPATVQERSEDQLDSIEASEQWQNKMQISTSAVTDMECSVGRMPLEPLELTARAESAGAPPEETAQEAAP